MSDLKVFFDVLPAPVWGILGTVFGAIITFTASIVANSGSNKRLKMQLEYDGKEKNIDRMNTLRREVYLTAVEEMTKTSAYLAALPTGNISSKNVSADLQGFFIAAAKLSLVASDPTQRAVDALGIQYTKLMFLAMQRLSPIQDVSSAMEINTNLYNQMMSDVRRILGEMNRFTEAGRTEANIFSALQNAFEFFSSQAQIYEQKRSEAADRFSTLLEEFNRLLFLDMKQISKFQVEVVISVRNDLGVYTDEDELRKKAETNFTEILEALDQSIETIKNS